MSEVCEDRQVYHSAVRFRDSELPSSPLETSKPMKINGPEDQRKSTNIEAYMPESRLLSSAIWAQAHSTFILNFFFILPPAQLLHWRIDTGTGHSAEPKKNKIIIHQLITPLKILTLHPTQRHYKIYRKPESMRHCRCI